MILCEVKGVVTSQQKEPCLVGKKLLVCETVQAKEQLVAVDLTGADVGSTVLVSRCCAAPPGEWIDDYIVAIVDDVPCG